MAGFGTKGRLPGSRNTPVHGAVDRAQEVVGNVEQGIRGGIGNVEQGARSGFESGAAGLRGVGDDLFGSQTAIGGIAAGIGSIFGGGSEQSASPASPVPARAAQGPTSMSQVSAPATSARPLVVAPTSMSTGANKTGNATKKRRKKGK